MIDDALGNPKTELETGLRHCVSATIIAPQANLKSAKTQLGRENLAARGKVGERGARR